MNTPTSLRVLLANSIDYAGLFPPATLDLKTSLQNFAEYLRSDDAWMLSTFVLPVAQFDAAAAHLPGFSSEHPLAISALGPKTADSVLFTAGVKGVMEAIRAFNAAEQPGALVRQLEMVLPPKLNHFATVADSLAGTDLRVFWEAPADQAEQTIGLIAQSKVPFGFKLRTGGITADSFPTAEEIASVLLAAARKNVAIKFTAGLHHPIRMFREEVGTKMHGFINVLCAGVLARQHPADEAQIIAILNDEDVSSFHFEDGFLRWREREISTHEIERQRQFVTSFGSCSFDEPRDDLRALGLL